MNGWTSRLALLSWKCWPNNQTEKQHWEAYESTNISLPADSSSQMTIFSESLASSSSSSSSSSSEIFLFAATWLPAVDFTVGWVPVTDLPASFGGWAPVQLLASTDDSWPPSSNAQYDNILRIIYNKWLQSWDLGRFHQSQILGLAMFQSHPGNLRLKEIVNKVLFQIFDDKITILATNKIFHSCKSPSRDS